MIASRPNVGRFLRLRYTFTCRPTVGGHCAGLNAVKI
jgi:hypothetical protein